MAYVYEAFGEERTVSIGLWPPRSPNLSTCDFYLRGNLYGKVYSNNPHTIEELKTNIRNTIAEIIRNLNTFGFFILFFYWFNGMTS